jgi:hypothetical protein
MSDDVRWAMELLYLVSDSKWEKPSFAGDRQMIYIYIYLYIYIAYITQLVPSHLTPWPMQKALDPGASSGGLVAGGSAEYVGVRRHDLVP